MSPSNLTTSNPEPRGTGVSASDSGIVGPSIVTLVSASLFATTFPPLELAEFAWIALAPWFAVSSRVSAPRGFALGCLWALGVGAGTAPFLPTTITDFFELNASAALAAASAATLATGIWYGAFGAWISLRSRQGAIGPFEVAAAWVVTEWCRCTLPIANPWALSGYSQATLVVPLQGASWFGVLGLGAVVALANATLAMIARQLRPRSPRNQALGAAAVLLAWFGFGWLTLARLPSPEKSRTVGLVQPSLDRGVRGDPSRRAAVLERNIALTRAAAEGGATLIVWPEYSLEWAHEEESTEARRVRALAKSTGTEILFGTLGIRPGGLSNSTLLVRPGFGTARYDKVDLLPFGERPVMGFVGGRAEFDLLPGEAREPVAASAGSLGILACNESMTGRPARTLVRKGAQVLVNLANDDWFDRSGRRTQMRIASLRAVEMRRYLLRSAQTGITAVVDPYGRVPHEARPDQPGVLRGYWQPLEGRSLYQTWGDAPLLGASMTLLAYGAWSARRRLRCDSRNPETGLQGSARRY